jgi:putative membrane protein
LIELIFWISLGILIGSITGIVPGIHSNNLIALIFLFSFFPALNISILILSAALMHSFADVIPSILFGAPEEATVFSVLAGHKFFLKGKGFQAIHLTLIGSMLAGITCFLIAPIFFLFLNKIEKILPELIPWILISVILLMIFEKNNLNFIKWNSLIIGLSGLLGIISLKMNTDFALLAGISGLFGASNAVYSLLNKPVIKKQKIEFSKINLIECIKWSSLSSVFACFTALLPGLTAGQTSLIAGKINKMSKKNYLVFVGGINTATQLMSLIVLFAIGKARTGTALGIQSLIELNLIELIQLFLIALIVLGIAFILSEFLAVKAINLMNKINYSEINLGVILLLFFFSSFFAGLNGIILFFTATAIGVLCNSLGVKKSTLMGFLLIPTILIYLGI